MVFNTQLPITDVQGLQGLKFRPGADISGELDQVPRIEPDALSRRRDLGAAHGRRGVDAASGAFATPTLVEADEAASIEALDRGIPMAPGGTAIAMREHSSRVM
jgi:hypothetical protein